MLSVSGNIGSRGYKGSKPKSIKGSNNPNDSPNDSPKAIRGEVSTLRAGTPLLSYTLIGYTAGTSTIGILTLVRYCLGRVVATLIEFSRLLLEALSPRNDAKGVAFKYYSKSNFYTVLIALLRRLLRVSGRTKLLAYYTPEGVSSI